MGFPDVQGRSAVDGFPLEPPHRRVSIVCHTTGQHILKTFAAYLFTLVLFVCAAGGAPQYHLIDLGTFDNSNPLSYSGSQALNGSGHTVGYSSYATGLRPFFYDGT